LRLPRAFLTLFLASIIALSFIALILRSRGSSFAASSPNTLTLPVIAANHRWDALSAPSWAFRFLAYPTQFAANVPVAEGSGALSNCTRLRMYEFIKANPGMQFRGICNGLGLCIGLAQFHLGVLKKAGLISFVRDGRYKRYFESKKYSKMEISLICLFRRGIVRDIFRNLLDKKKMSHGELAQELSVTSQGLTWQMNRLKKARVIQVCTDRKNVIYSSKEFQTTMFAQIVGLVENR
jgi:DNA-binding transcriptional ArsR family regulator